MKKAMRASSQDIGITSGAFLGISIGSPYYSRQRIGHYLAYARLKFSSFAFLIGDDIFRFTLAALRGIAIDDALARARTIGDEREVMLRDAIHTAGIHSVILRWTAIANIPQYAPLLECLREAYRKNRHFKDGVRKQVFVNLGDRVAETGLSRNSHVDNYASSLFDSYILEEIAGLVTVSEYTPYVTEIYPGRDLQILQQIYKNRFPDISEALPGIKRRRFLQLRIDEEEK